MKTFHFKTEQTLDQPISEVFEFFSDAHNLALITPPWLRFEVLTPAPIQMSPGTRIDYRLRLRGIPLRWQSEITEWNPPYAFADEQRRGPYRLWRHTHTFDETESGVVIRDSVEYAIWGGGLVNKFFVHPDIEKIFAYRATQLDEIFRQRKNSTSL